MHPNNKKFISFEGIEGVGKSTNIQYVAQLLKDHNQDYILTREPGGTPLAESLRQLLLKQSQEDEKIWPDTEILLFYAGRLQHVKNVIYPALHKGQWVLCDRFVDATFAYQGGGRGIEKAHIEALNHWTLGDFIPAYTFLFDAPPEVGFARIQTRGPLDRIEQEKSAFFARSREAYLERAHQDPSRFIVIDAQKSLSDIQLELKTAIEKIIKI
jgi:dTMP kinase